MNHEKIWMNEFREVMKKTKLDRRWGDAKCKVGKTRENCGENPKER